MAFFSHVGQIMKEHWQMGRDDCRSEDVSELRGHNRTGCCGKVKTAFAGRSHLDLLTKQSAAVSS
eukprot:4475763-Karenia_brevis.AAC.1